jgi:hypothetical protein
MIMSLIAILGLPFSSLSVFLAAYGFAHIIDTMFKEEELFKNSSKNK